MNQTELPANKFAGNSEKMQIHYKQAVYQRSENLFSIFQERRNPLFSLNKPLLRVNPLPPDFEIL